jgi:hypothetical protein
MMMVLFSADRAHLLGGGQTGLALCIGLHQEQCIAHMAQGAPGTCMKVSAGTTVAKCQCKSIQWPTVPPPRSDLHKRFPAVSSAKAAATVLRHKQPCK